MRALNKVWWLLALCGVLDAMCAAMNLLMINPDGWLTLRRLALPATVWDLSLLALVAGASAILAGLWNSGRDHAWLLSVHGAALAAFGFIGISPLVRGPLSFRPISLLFLLMALSVGTFAMAAGHSLRNDIAARWFLRVSGTASIGFAFSFLAVGFGWVRLRQPSSFWIWMSSYFGLCAIFMLWLALHARNQGLSPSGPREALPPVATPRHAT